MNALTPVGATLRANSVKLGIDLYEHFNELIKLLFLKVPVH
jgi:hypothetical protein